MGHRAQIPFSGPEKIELTITIKDIRKKIHDIKKAGVIAWNISDAGSVQGDLFDTVDRPRLDALMKVVDNINHRNGHDTLRTAIQGYSQQWHLKNEHISRQYTTNLDQIITLKAR